MTTTNLYEHPDGEGCIEYGDGIMIVANDTSSTVSHVLIGPAGLRDLASRLNALADQIGEEA